MQTPLESDIWIDMEYDAPEKVKPLVEAIRDIYFKLFSLDGRGKVRYKITNTFKSKQLLGYIRSEFSSVFQYSAELLNKKDEQDVKKFQSDLINMDRQVQEAINILITRPEEQLNLVIFSNIKSLIYEPLNSLICPSLIDAWKKSSKKIPPSKHYSVDEQVFFSTLYSETLNRAGQHPAFTVFKAPKTIATPYMTPGVHRSLVEGVYDKIKDELEHKEEPEHKNIPPELLEETKERSKIEEKDEEVIADEESEEESEEADEEKEESEDETTT